jgi:large subunit ribosomal protein L10
MSKYVKNLIANHLQQRLQGVNDAFLVNVIGLKANANHRLRSELQNKHIHLVVVKNSMAALATKGTSLSPLFDKLDGTAAICWGGDDIVSLAKEIVRMAKDEHFAPFAPRGGVIDGQRLTDKQVTEVSKWPTRTEQLSILAGQMLSPGANLVSQLTSIGGALASQIEQRGKSDEEDQPSESAPDQPLTTPDQTPATTETN